MKELDLEGKAALQTLMDAEEIKKDKAKMKSVMQHAKHKMATIQSIADLKTAYNAKYGEGRLMRKKMESMKEDSVEGKKHESAESAKKELTEDKTGKE